jgi:hypothetical protein
VPTRLNASAPIVRNVVLIEISFSPCGVTGLPALPLGVLCFEVAGKTFSSKKVNLPSFTRNSLIPSATAVWYARGIPSKRFV